MPVAPSKPCGAVESGRLCPNLRPCPHHKHGPFQTAQRSTNLYSSSRWKALRLYHLRANPLCVDCLSEGRTVGATVADHIRPHRGDPSLFWDAGNLASRCKRHHDAKTAREIAERR